MLTEETFLALEKMLKGPEYTKAQAMAIDRILRKIDRYDEGMAPSASFNVQWFKITPLGLCRNVVVEVLSKAEAKGPSGLSTLSREFIVGPRGGLQSKNTTKYLGRHGDEAILENYVFSIEKEVEE